MGRANSAPFPLILIFIFIELGIFVDLHVLQSILQNTDCKTLTAFTLYIAPSAHTLKLCILVKPKTHATSDFRNTNNILLHKNSAIPNHFNQSDHNISMLQALILQNFSINPKCPTISDRIRKKANNAGLQNSTHTHTHSKWPKYSHSTQHH